MTKLLRSAAMVLVAIVAAVTSPPAVAFTQTNVLQNINVQFSIYQQGTVNATGTKLPDKVTSFSTKNLLSALSAVTGVNFGTGAKLVQSTVYAVTNLTIGSPGYSNSFSTNLAIATNGYLTVGGVPLYGTATGDIGIEVISNNSFTTTSTGFALVGQLETNIVSDVAGASTNSITIYTNGPFGALTTFTPSTNDAGFDTNVLVVSQVQVSDAPNTNIFTNVSTSIDVLYGGTENLLYDVSDYLIFSSTNSPEIVVESGVGLETANPGLISQTGYCISNLLISYFTTNSANNLNLNLTGFVKQALKVDVLSGHGPTAVAEDIFGASATWSVIGFGYSGGGFIPSTTDPSAVPVYLEGDFFGYLTNTTPVVVQGTVSVSFLKNLPQ